MALASALRPRDRAGSFRMTTLPMDVEVSRARPAPAKRRTRRDDPPTSVVIEIGLLRSRLAAARETERTASVLLAKRLSDVKRLAGAVARESQPADLRVRLRASGLFEHEVYLSLNPDLNFNEDEAWHHYLTHGCNEGRAFTSPEVVARLLAQMEPARRAERYRFKMMAEAALVGADNRDTAALLRRRGIRVGVFCSSIGNFFMREIADLLAGGLEGKGISAIQRDEAGNPEEPFDLRVFVAPHEFFYLGAGREWRGIAGAANSIMYNVEQAQTQWFGRAFPLLLKAPLVLDINFQTAEILRRAGCNAVHFMPGHLPNARYAQPCLDISEIELTKGYRFARQPYNWLERDRLEDRPIDLLFVGTAAPRRDTPVRLHAAGCAAAQPGLPHDLDRHQLRAGPARQNRPQHSSRLARLFRMVAHGAAGVLAGSLRGL